MPTDPILQISAALSVESNTVITVYWVAVLLYMLMRLLFLIFGYFTIFTMLDARPSHVVSVGNS